ncbi:MAG: protein kinase [Mobilitalea sp.]
MGTVVGFLQDYKDNNIFCTNLPDKITEEYTVEACLKESQWKQVYIIVRKSDGLKCVLKCLSPESKENPEEEYQLQSKLMHEGLVPVIEVVRNESCTYLIREYIEGDTITDLVEMTKQGKLSDTIILNIIKQLCQVLNYLHSQKPPIIHRDIKPDNIIIMKDGRLKLIDFGISRRFNDEQNKDTVIMGSQYLAPPEQYGFLQTDARSDIYSLGILMFYMTTGSLDIKEMNEFIISKHLKRSILKCTRFSPKDRYSSVKQIATELLLVNTLVQHRKSLKILAVILILCAFIGSNLFTIQYYKSTHRNTGHNDDTLTQENIPPSFETSQEQSRVPSDITAAADGITAKDVSNLSDTANIADNADTEDISNITDTSGGFVSQTITDSEDSLEYHFTSPLIEEAVRYELKKEDHEIITLADLKQIKKLTICGKQIFDDWYEISPLGDRQFVFDTKYHADPLYNVKGDISSVEDLSLMVNLTSLALYNQQIEDLSPLKDLVSLERLGIASNYIEDLSPLEGLKNLKKLSVSDNVINNQQLQSIKELTSLELLDIGATDITSIYDIRDMKLHSLSVFDNFMGDFEGLENMQDLEELITSGLETRITEEALQRIATLTKLRMLNISGGEGFDLSLLSNMKLLEDVVLSGIQSIDVSELNNPRLTALRVDYIKELKLSGIEKFPRLSYVSVSFSVCEDFTPLMKITRLNELQIDRTQEEQLYAQIGHGTYRLDIQDHGY